MGEKVAGIGRRLAVGDWNSHHPKWSLNRTRVTRGAQLHEGMTQLGLEVVDDCIWETFRRGASQKSRIDLVFKSEEVEWPDMECEGLQSDHAYISGTIQIQQTLPSIRVRKSLHKLRLKAYFKEIGHNASIGTGSVVPLPGRQYSLHKTFGPRQQVPKGV